MSASNDVIPRCILSEEVELFFQLLGGTYCEQNERRLFGPSRTPVRAFATSATAPVPANSLADGMRFYPAGRKT